jgi:DNA-binding NarL/FixJ family response regulator
MQNHIRVLLIEYQTLTRIGIKTILSAQSDIEIVGEAAGDAEISRALKSGALGYVCKDVSANDLLKAIRIVGAGKKYIPQAIADILSESFGQEELTPSERKILRFVTSGQSNKEIAFNLDISENTVKTHVKNLFDKLGVSDRTSAATLAIRRGLVRIDR